MRKELFFEKITIRGFIFITLLVLILFSAFYLIVKQKFEVLQEDELDRYISIIEESITQAYQFTDDYEHLADKTMYQTAMNIRFEIGDKKAKEISDEELLRLKEKHKLDGLALFVPEKDDIIILNSTTQEEKGASTKKWGYWFRSFKDLLEGREVATKTGFYITGFWAGPRTYSYFNKGYYKFSYIRSNTKDYLINPYLRDDRLGSVENSGHISSVLKGIKDHIEHIDDIAIIDADLWKKMQAKANGKVNDPPIIYGSLDSKNLVHTRFSVDEILKSKTKLVDFTEDRKKRKIFFPLSKTRILVMIVNSQSIEDMQEAMIYIFVVLGIVSILSIAVVSFLLINKYSGLLNIEKERLNLANTFRDTIKKLPDLIYQCRLDKNGRIFLIYNEGKFFKNHEVILGPENKKEMNLIYGNLFMEDSKEYLYEAFHKKSVRFESRMGNRYFDHIVSPVFDSGIDRETGHIRHIVGFATDITERVEREKNSAFMARNDALTGLTNRFGFEEHVSRLMKNLGRKEKFFLLFIDLDGFKSINDTAGHYTGDQILKQVALRLKSLSGADIFMARIGGDEFAVSYRTTIRQNAIDLADMILINLSSKIEIDDQEFYIGASIGISSYPESGKTYKDLLNSADQAMYKVKKSGGNNFTTTSSK